MINVQSIFSPKGDGTNDFLIIEGIKDYPENKLVVFTNGGIKVFEMKNYDNESRVFHGKGNENEWKRELPEGTYFYILEYKNNVKWKLMTGWFVLVKLIIT